MKIRFASILLFAMILTACAPAATATEETATQPAQAAEATEPPATQAPTLIPTAAPSLKVGDSYSYTDGTKLVAVPAGGFTMGGNGNDNPGHPVTLHDYWIYSTLVTNQQYALCVQLGKCTAPDLTDNPGYSDIQRANHPVTGVTYDQAAAYCTFVNGRLPTEAEWEKAAGDSKGDSYPWGDQPPSCDLANFNDCVNGKTNVTDHTGGASYYGALDMLGNVFQWVADWYDAKYYNNSPADDPTGPASGTARVLRSSGFNTDQEGLSIFNRSSEDPQTHRSDIGFRCVVDQPDQFAPVCELPLLYSGEASSTCPTLELVQEELCAKNFPYTNVMLKGATDATVDAKGCTQIKDSAKVSCQPPNDLVSASAQCQVDISGQSSCPAGYSLQGNTCRADGAQGTCPDGLSFDSSKQCCGLPAGADTSLKTSVCPVGTFYFAGQNTCMPTPIQELVTVTAKVKFKDCSAKSPGSGGGGNGTPAPACDQPPDKCIYRKWDPQQCKCVPL